MGRKGGAGEEGGEGGAHTREEIARILQAREALEK
jgi:hypothetical protein